MEQIIIDIEYPGHDAKIKQHILNLFWRSDMPIAAMHIDFGYIGKKSPAHERALAVFAGEIPPDKVIGEQEIIAEF